MQVLDRQNLEKVIAEGESGYYADENNFVQLGKVADVQYILNGALQKTGSGFSLQLKITDAASGASKAVYTGNVPATELEDLTGVKKASADLLAQLGVALTDAGKTSLLGAATSNAAAETALAKGITAQRSGTIVEALSYYYEAAKFDPSLAEAASRSSVLSANITGGNIGANVRNDIQARAAWNKTFQEAAAFFKEHPPYELIYDTALTTGKIDYNRETAEISFKTKLIATTGFRIIYDLYEGLAKNGRWRDWGISDSIDQAIPKSYEFNAILVNEAGETIGQSRVSFNPERSSAFSDLDRTVQFSGVDANKITDKLTVSIVSVNGMDAKAAGERGYMGISAEDFAVWEAPGFQLAWRFGSLSIARYTGTNKDVVIPSQIGRWHRFSIGEEIFYRKDLTSVTIPNSVTSIGDSAFIFNRLTSATIPNSVTYIGRTAFSSNQLTSITIPNSVTSIAEEAFSNNQLTSITIPNSVTSIGKGAFRNNRLTSATIPNSVTSIEREAFSNNQLTSVTIPDSVTSIGFSAFSDNRLTSVTIPNSVTSIGGYAFKNNQLTSVTIPNSVTSIEQEAFRDNRLTSVTIPNSVTSIGKHAFFSNQLTSVTIPNSVTSIGESAFSSNRLTSVTMPDNVELEGGAIPCQGTYNTNGKKAGTYVKVDEYTWTLRK
jgi:hypothetical protein